MAEPRDELDRVIAGAGAAEETGTKTGGTAAAEAGVAGAPMATAAYGPPRGSAVDRLHARLTAGPLGRAAWTWGAPLAVTALAATLRLVGLAHPHELVFDETYYVKDAWTLLHLGYESRWPAEADASFEAGDTDRYLDGGSFVVHPPLGKWIIALGLAVFGAGDPFGWRVATALVGILLVVVTMLVAKRLFGSTGLASLAGLLLAIDGNAIVMSRVALLDGILALFVLLGVGAIVLDRRHARSRLALWLARREHREKGIDTGPALWWRPWLFTAGIAFGLATAVKWNGLYYLAAFAVYSLVSEALARRRAGVSFWVTGSILKQGPVSFLIAVPIAFAAYLASWTGWFLTDGGYYRDWAADKPDASWGFLPETFRSWWHYQEAVYGFHVNQEQPHGYQANPLGWPLLLRPTAMFYRSIPEGGECGQAACGQFITGIANPLIWWAAVAAALWLGYRFVRTRRWQHAVILLGIGAGYLPWLLYLDRTVFQFYTIVFEPYLVLALVAALASIAGRPDAPEWRRVQGLALVAVFVIACVLVSVFFWPLWTGMTVPTWFLQAHYWLPGWR